MGRDEITQMLIARRFDSKRRSCKTCRVFLQTHKDLVRHRHDPEHKARVRGLVPVGDTTRNRAVLKEAGWRLHVIGRQLWVPWLVGRLLYVDGPWKLVHGASYEPPGLVAAVRAALDPERMPAILAAVTAGALQSAFEIALEGEKDE